MVGAAESSGCAAMSARTGCSCCADLQDQVPASFEEGNRLVDQAGDRSQAVGTAIKGKVGLVIANSWLQSRNHMGRNVGRVGDNEVKSRISRNRFQQVAQTEIDAPRDAVSRRVLAGQSQSVGRAIDGHELHRCVLMRTCDCQASRARANIDGSGPLQGFGEIEKLDDREFRLGTRYEDGRRNLQGE